MTDDRLTEIEFKLAHQEQTILELNDVITDQQSRMMQLEELCKSLIDKVQSLADAGADEGGQHEVPPHY
ncbi:MAG: SlyX family protein [Woeseiaceae bacterium]|nr:SlyX family protein [Woeseiaceae bacterium]